MEDQIDNPDLQVVDDVDYALKRVVDNQGKRQYTEN
jgi:hypothetical protein